VAKADVLARVKNDLALGHTYLATQRLRTLLAVDPADLEVRRLLAAIYRQTGNLAEAGRWAYLTEDIRPEELAAFARANPSPWLRLRLLSWTADPATLPGDAARARLIALVDEAETGGPPTRWAGSYQAPRPRSAVLPCLFVILVLLLIGALAVIGVLRMARYILS
jgi:hypothetical protein